MDFIKLNELQNTNVIIQGLKENQVICLMCSNLTNQDTLATPRELKDILETVTAIENSFLSQDGLDFCPNCQLKVRKLQNNYDEFLKLQKLVYKLSTEICYEIVMTYAKLTTRKCLEPSSFTEWNNNRLQRLFGTTHQQDDDQQFLDDDDVDISEVEESKLSIPETTTTDLKSLKYKCQESGCTKSYRTSKALELHKRLHSSLLPSYKNKSKFVCDQCNGKEFVRSYSFRLHMKRKHPTTKESLKCTYSSCNNKNFTSSATLKAHIKIFHNIKDESTNNRFFKCPICQKNLSTFRSLECHLHRHNVKDFTTSSLRCESCDLVVDSPLRFLIHLERHKGNYVCSIPSCRKSFRSCAELENIHMKIHEKDSNLFECDACTQTFEINDEFGVNKHIEELHLKTQSLCEHCGASFASKQLLSTHLRQHQNAQMEEDNICKVCNKKFSSKSNLSVHMKLHLGDRLFKCSECELSFNQKVSLISHQRKHSGIMPNKCQYCNHVGFSYAFGLRRHLAEKHRDIYLQKKKYLSEVCYYNFDTLVDFEKHKVIHEKHKCKTCSKQFRMLIHLKEHILLQHASLLPHKCMFCENRAFLRKKLLINHILKFHPNQEISSLDSDNVTYIVHLT